MNESIIADTLVIATTTWHTPVLSDIPFFAGQVLKVLAPAASSKSMYMAEDGYGIRGNIPKDKVRPVPDVVDEDLFLVDCNKVIAEKMLVHRENGTFLVRQNPHEPDRIVVSAKFDSIVHFRIQKHGTELCMSNRTFRSIPELVLACSEEPGLNGKLLTSWLKTANHPLPDIACPIVSRETFRSRIIAGPMMKATKSYNCSDFRCLRIIENNIYEILRGCRDPKWLIAKDSQGNEGYVPLIYLESHIPEWFHGRLDREKAEQLLYHTGRDGTFLVRERIQKPGSYVLSVWCPDEIVHIQIMFQNGVLVTGSNSKLPSFTCVFDLIGYYKSQGVFWTQDDRCVRFLFPLTCAEASLPGEIQQMDIGSINLYFEALEAGTEKVSDIRVMVLGHYGAGKTSLIRRLLGQQAGEPDSTNGIDVHVKKCRIKLDTGEWEYISQVDDEDETSERLARLIEKRASPMDDSWVSSGNASPDSSAKQGFYLPDDEQSCDTAKPGITDNREEKEILQQNTGFSTPKGLIFHPDGTSTPDSGKNVYIHRTEGSHESALSRAHNLSKKQLNKIAEILQKVDKTGKVRTHPCMISVWDFAGQFIFYATHQLFLCPRAVYLLVFDLSKPLELEVVDEDFPLRGVDMQSTKVSSFGLLWLKSIHTFCGTVPGQPPVILVGTHFDKLEGSFESKKEKAELYFEKFRTLLDKSPLLEHIVPSDFYINTLDVNWSIEPLRMAIMKAAEEFSVKEIPAKWIPLERALLKMRRKKKLATIGNIIRADKANEVSIRNMDQIRLFLRYHHMIGTIVYFDEEELSHDDPVVLDPQWIIDAFKSIITATRFCQMHADLRGFWTDLKEKAILQKELITAIWSQDETTGFFRHKDKLLQYMEKLDIIARPKVHSVDSDSLHEASYYFVPSLLRAGGSDPLLSELEHKKNRSSALCIVFNEGYAPPAIFHRLIGASLNKWPVMEFDGHPQLFADTAAFDLDSHHSFLLRIAGNIIQICVYNLCDMELEYVHCDKVRRFVRATLKTELGRYQQTSPYTLCVQCEGSSLKSASVLSCTELMEKGMLPCKSHGKIHSVKAEILLSCWYSDKFKNTSTGTQREIWFEMTSSESRYRSLTELDLSRISKGLGANWELIGVALGVSQAQIDQSKLENPHSVAVQIFDVLMKWKRKLPKEASVDALVQALLETQSVHVDWEVVKNVVDRI
ncbi:hypothetical protein ACJMK2_015076 [Sinanodonta woodiana]|uniref:non-specific serine/threonine protein kinase n=1 Tax=Sinanodonta woodiana TaxID=1069815 RepID=A0ABD3V2K1_SINWO